MTEYKFRGKGIDNDEWVYGSVQKYILSETSTIYFIVPFDSFERYRVKPETIGQFSNMHDRNGVEIFEGDILKTFNEDDIGSYYYNDMSVVDFYNGSFHLTLLYDMIEMSLSDYKVLYNPSTDYNIRNYLCSWLKDFEVVGNYTDNKNILKKDV